MKPMLFIPPAQAEALSDAQDDLMPDEPRFGAGLRQPWRDEDAAEDFPPPELLPRQRRDGSNAQLWPSSVNSSR